jgi:O-antigen/teichoic acid export membrane protein
VKENGPASRRLIQGSLFLFLDRAVRMGVGFGVGVILARYYGPHLYGELSYLIALTAVLGSLASFGLDELLPRDLAGGIEHLDQPAILKTGFVIRFLTECTAYLALVAVLMVGDFPEETRTLGSLLGLYYVFQATDVIEFFLRVDRQFRTVALVRMASSLSSGALKVLVAVLGLPLIAVIGAMLFEFALASSFFLAIYQRLDASKNAHFAPHYAKSLVIRGLPLVLSGGLMILQTRMDSLLIEMHFSSASLGQYSAAQRMTELLDIVAIVLSMLLIPEFGRRQGKAFEQLSETAYLSGYLLFTSFLPILLIISEFFEVIYGSEYVEGPSLIPWLAIRPLLYVISVIRVAMLVAEGRLNIIPLYPALTAGLTYLLFVPLTSSYGLKGAAMAGSLGALFSGVFLDLLFNRKNLRSLFICPRAFPLIWGTLRNALNKTR